MAIVVKVVSKDNGDEPVVAADQAAPILDENSPEMPWNEGTVNDGHEDLPPPPPVKGAGQESIPENETTGGGCPPPPQQDSDVSGGEPVSECDSQPSESGDVGQEIGDGDELCDDPTESDGAMAGSVPPLEDGADEDTPDAPPPPVGEAETAEAEIDEQTEDAPQQAEQEAQGAETLEHEDTGTLVTDQEMVSHGKTVSSDHKAEQVPVTAVVGDCAKVGYSCGFTKNIGEYNSLKATVSITLPCEPTATAIEKTYALAVQFVDGKLQQLWSDA